MKTTLSLLCAGFLLCLHAQATPAVTLWEILDDAGTSSTITAAQGATFTAQVLVTNIPEGAPLDSFDLTFATLPAGLTLTSFTDSVLPSGWAGFPAVAMLRYGGGNFTGSDVSGNQELVLANFQVSPTMTTGLYVDGLTFTAPGTFQDLTDSDEDTLPYTLDPATLDITGSDLTAVPEPSTSWAALLAVGGALGMIVRRRFTRLA